jgi:hypothetical protein
VRGTRRSEKQSEMHCPAISTGARSFKGIGFTRRRYTRRRERGEKRRTNRERARIYGYAVDGVQVQQYERQLPRAGRHVQHPRMQLLAVCLQQPAAEGLGTRTVLT